MKYNVSAIQNIKNKHIKKEIYKLNKFLLKQNEKVSYAYKDTYNNTFSFNNDICFYSASAIKFLACLYIYENAEKDKNILEKKLKFKDEDFKGGSGILKNQKNKKEYTIKELIYYTLKESDNTAYIKLVNYIGKDNLKEYGLSLGAKHTLEGKDLFGITNSNDMVIYLTHLHEYLNKNTKLSNELKECMLDPSYQIIKPQTFKNNLFVRKYGSFGIAFHEVGIVYTKNPFVVVILTQKNELSDKEKIKYINKVAKKIYKINKKMLSEM